MSAQSQMLEQVQAEVAPAQPPEAEEAVGLVVSKLEGWGDTAVVMLPNLAVALLTLLVFWLISKLVRKVLGAALRKTPLAMPLRNLFVTALGLVVMTAGFFVALAVMGLDKTVVSLLAGVGILGLALGFAFQDIAANFIAGIVISVRQPIHVGDVIETNDHFGTVHEINLRSTIVRTPTGQIVFIPNKQVFESPIVNYSKAGKRRVDLKVGVSYGDDLEKAKRLAIEAVESVTQRDQRREVELFFEEFGSSSIDFVVRFWVDYRRQRDYLSPRSEAIMAIKKTFDDNGITIPFPIRTLDFGIVGGGKLSEELNPVVDAISDQGAPRAKKPS